MLHPINPSDQLMKKTIWLKISKVVDISVILKSFDTIDSIVVDVLDLKTQIILGLHFFMDILKLQVRMILF